MIVFVSELPGDPNTMTTGFNRSENPYERVPMSAFSAVFQNDPSRFAQHNMKTLCDGSWTGCRESNLVSSVVNDISDYT